MSDPKQNGNASARAQSGFAVASGITTLVVAAGFFTGIGDKAHEARYLAGAALAIWLLTMFLFLRAETARERTATGIRAPMAQAIAAAATATVFTIVAFVVITATTLSVDVDSGVVRLNDAGQASVSMFCHHSEPALLPGEVEVPSLSKDFVVFTIDARSCFENSSATVKLPQKDVLAFLEDHKPHG